MLAHYTFGKGIPHTLVLSVILLIVDAESIAQATAGTLEDVVAPA